MIINILLVITRIPVLDQHISVLNVSPQTWRWTRRRWRRRLPWRWSCCLLQSRMPPWRTPPWPSAAVSPVTAPLGGCSLRNPATPGSRVKLGWLPIHHSVVTILMYLCYTTWVPMSSTQATNDQRFYWSKRTNLLWGTICGWKDTLMMLAKWSSGVAGIFTQAVLISWMVAWMSFSSTFRTRWFTGGKKQTKNHCTTTPFQILKWVLERFLTHISKWPQGIKVGKEGEWVWVWVLLYLWLLAVQLWGPWQSWATQGSVGIVIWPECAGKWIFHPLF